MNHSSKHFKGLIKHPFMNPFKGLFIVGLVVMMLFSTYSVNSQSPLSYKGIGEPMITDIIISNNPVTTNTLLLVLMEDGSLDVVVDIYTLLGQFEKKFTQRTFDDGLAQQYDVASLAAGLYLLKLTDVSSNEVVFRKILIS